MEDRSGLAVGTESRAAVDHWNALVQAFLAHGAATPDHLGATLGADPDFALAHASKGLFLMLLGRSELAGTAQAAHADALRSGRARGLSRREAQYVAALGDWLGGGALKAADRLAEVARLWPEDALAMKLVQAIRFMMGDIAGMRCAVGAQRAAMPSDHWAMGYVEGCHAFTLEESGEYALAEQAGLRALELAPNDAWGLHAVAHVYDMTGRPAGGIRLVEDHAEAWESCNNFRYHIWWHLALLHLERNEHDAVLALYDNKIRSERTDDYRDVANAVSLLARLELEGVDVGARWQELADLASRRARDGAVVFADLHYLLALCAAGRDTEAGELIDHMAACAAAGGRDMDRVMDDPGLGMARALRAWGRRDWAGAAAAFDTAMPHACRIGGSHAQRDVFHRIAVEASLRAGALADAGDLIAHRFRLRGTWDRFGAARAQRLARAAVAPIAAAVQ